MATPNPNPGSIGLNPNANPNAVPTANANPPQNSYNFYNFPPQDQHQTWAQDRTSAPRPGQQQYGGSQAAASLPPHMGVTHGRSMAFIPARYQSRPQDRVVTPGQQRFGGSQTAHPQPGGIQGGDREFSQGTNGGGGRGGAGCGGSPSNSGQRPIQMMANGIAYIPSEAATRIQQNAPGNGNVNKTRNGPGSGGHMGGGFGGDVRPPAGFDGLGLSLDPRYPGNSRDQRADRYASAGRWGGQGGFGGGMGGGMSGGEYGRGLGGAPGMGMGRQGERRR